MTENEPQPDRLLTPPEVCEMLGVTNVQLQDWRTAKKGPPFVRLGHRTVRYRLSAVRAFIAATEGESARDA